LAFEEVKMALNELSTFGFLLLRDKNLIYPEEHEEICQHFFRSLQEEASSSPVGGQTFALSKKVGLTNRF